MALLGPNGAGKTTTVEILEGYRAATPATSRCSASTRRPAAGRTASGSGSCCRRPGFEDEFSVRELLRLQAGYYPHPGPVDATIEMVGLEDKAGARVKTLSGGQRRRLDLALGIIGEPEVLFLDEPTTGLRPLRPPPGLGAGGPAARPRDHDPADHALHGRGRAPRRPPRGPGPRTGRRARARPDALAAASGADTVVSFRLPAGVGAAELPAVGHGRGGRRRCRRAVSATPTADVHALTALGRGPRPGAGGPAAVPAGPRGRLPAPRRRRRPGRGDVAMTAVAALAAAGARTRRGRAGRAPDPPRGRRHRPHPGRAVLRPGVPGGVLRRAGLPHRQRDDRLPVGRAAGPVPRPRVRRLRDRDVDVRLPRDRAGRDPVQRRAAATVRHAAAALGVLAGRVGAGTMLALASRASSWSSWASPSSTCRSCGEPSPAVVVTVLVAAMSFSALGLALAAWAPSMQAAVALANGIVISLAFVSDLFVVGALPGWMDAVGWIFPLKHLVNTLGDAFNPYLTGAGFARDHLAVIAAWGVVGRGPCRRGGCAVRPSTSTPVRRRRSPRRARAATSRCAASAQRPSRARCRSGRRPDPPRERVAVARLDARSSSASPSRCCWWHCSPPSSAAVAPGPTTAC